MAAQPASANDRRVTRLSISTTTTTLTPSTKAYATPPSSQTIPSFSSTSAVAPALVDAFASLTVEVPRSPQQQQEVGLRTAEHRSQNASQSAKLCSVIVTRSTEHRSSTAAQLTEPRAQASTRSPRTNRRDDEKQQNSHKSGTKVPSDSVDRLVKGIGAVQIHQPSASTHLQTTSPPAPATPTNQKRGRSDYEEENSIEERLAKLYVGPPPPPGTSTSASASTLTPAVTPLSTPTTAMTTYTSMSHNRHAKTSLKKTSPKGSKPSESQLEPFGVGVDKALHNLRAARRLVVAVLACEPHRLWDIYMQCEYAHILYMLAHIDHIHTQSTDLARIEYQPMYEQARNEYLQMYEQMRDDFHRRTEQAIFDNQQKYYKGTIDLHQTYYNGLIDSQRMYDKEWTESRRKYDKEWTESRRKYDKEWTESRRKYDKALIESRRKYDKARIESQGKYDKAWMVFERKYDKERMESRQMYDKECMEAQRKYDKAWIESQRKYDKAWIESQRKYVQMSEHRKKSIQNARNKPAQQHRQLPQSHHQAPPQYKQRLEELVDKSSRPLLSKDADTVPSSLPESVSSGSREDGDKTSEDHGRRRKRVKHDIKKEPIDETMSDATIDITSFPTITSTESTTSTFSTSSGHTVADVTLNMQNRLNFNPTTAIFQ